MYFITNFKLKKLNLSGNLLDLVPIPKRLGTQFLNVYIKVNYELLKNNSSYEGRVYRYKVGRMLLDNKRNKEALELRKKDFSALFLNV